MFILITIETIITHIMEFVLLSAVGLVASQYNRVTRSNAMVHSPPDVQSSASLVEVGHPYIQKQETNVISGQGSIGVNDSDPVHAPVGVRVLKTDNTTSPEFDQKRFDDQFFPEDPNAQLPEKPWMRMLNAPYEPKTEILSDSPTPQDVRGENMFKKVQKIESEFAKKTVPITSEKQFDRPVEQVMTANGSNKGFHIGGAQEYIKRNFLDNFKDNPNIEQEGGPRGAFSSAGKATVAGEYRTTTQRATLSHESIGPGYAVGVPQSSAALPSFKITAANMESWKLDDHAMKGSRAPIQASNYISKNSVAVTHDENLQVVETGLMTGQSVYSKPSDRDAKVHVPLNMDTLPEFDDRVAPNFKIGKSSTSLEQQLVRIKNTEMPELSQNTAAIRGNQKAPITGNTTNKDTGIDTGAVSVGTSSRGLSLQAASVPSDGFRMNNRKEAMGESIFNKMSGASGAHSVSGSRATGSVLTTSSLSESVPTPFIKGGGGKQVSALHRSHEEADTRLTEIESSGARSKANLYKKPVDTTSLSETTLGNDRQNIEKGYNRKTMIASVNKDLPLGLAINPTGSIGASKMKLSLKKENEVDMSSTMGVMRNQSSSLSNKKSPGDSTKSRRLGELLNKRMGSSENAKKILGNRYLKPAQKRLDTM
jgi:hypothetical protein